MEGSLDSQELEKSWSSRCIDYFKTPKGLNMTAQGNALGREIPTIHIKALKGRNILSIPHILLIELDSIFF
ncbi:MAG: hypothetical protein ABSA77_09070, partial [Thermoguttaceae bacterium]